MTDFSTSSSHGALVDPRTLKGFQDHLPEDAILHNQVVEKIRRVFERYGYLPIDTPILEYLVTLVGTAGEETNKQIFRLESPEHEAIGLRFDLTVPFARLLAQYPDRLRLPFRRYHIGPVFRADKPDPGRYRQFSQFDIDAAGSESVAVDAEIIAVMCDVMEALQVDEYKILVNDRKLLDSLLDDCGITDLQRQRHVLRVIDKLAKAGIENVKKELGEGRVDESGDPIRGVGLDSETIDRIERFISVGGRNRAEVFSGVSATLPATDLAKEALAETELLIGCLEGLGLSEDLVKFDPSLARGLDYYTGPVFEAVLPKAAGFGSVMGGGRYDNLVERFLEGKIPSTGMSVGLDRLLAALRHIGAMEPSRTTTQALVITMRGMPAAENLKIAAELRAEGICAEVYFGGGSSGMKAQLSYANSKGIPIAVILGEDELKSGQVSVKDLQSGMEKRAEITDREKYRKAGKTGQQTVPRDQLVATVRSVLGLG